MVISARDQSIIGQGTMGLDGNIISGSVNSRSLLRRRASRRTFLASSISTGFACGSLRATEATNSLNYRIGVCDWMILKRQKLGAMALAKEIGADGVEVDMGSLGERETFENALADANIRQQFLDTAKQQGIEICSIAMSGFYAQSFAERPTYQKMVRDSVATAALLKVNIVFLPLGVPGDLNLRPELRPAVVDRLRVVGKMAEDVGITIGIETALDATKEVQLLQEVGSTAIKSYFNFSNPLQNGRDLCEEIRILGKERICQIHCTDEDGVLLQHNQRLDLVQVKQVLDAMRWRGWLVMERSRDAKNSRDVRGNYGANARFLKQVFQKEQ
jgi:sugar phosphate isomerase/epimerase